MGKLCGLENFAVYEWSMWCYARMRNVETLEPCLAGPWLRIWRRSVAWPHIIHLCSIHGGKHEFIERLHMEKMVQELEWLWLSEVRQCLVLDRWLQSDHCSAYYSTRSKFGNVSLYVSNKPLICLTYRDSWLDHIERLILSCRDDHQGKVVEYPRDKYIILTSLVYYGE